MKPNFIVLIVVIISAVLGAYYFQNKTPVNAKVNYAPIDTSVPEYKHQKTPEFEVTLINSDKTVKIPTDVAGKVVLLNFWASWCAPCVAEFPILVEVAETFKDDLIFLGLSSDMSVNAINMFFDKLKYAPSENEWMVHDNQGKITNKIFQTYMLPETILIDQQGQIIRKYVGVDWTKEEMIEDIRQLITPKAP